MDVVSFFTVDRSGDKKTYIDGNQVNLCVTVLSSLGGRHVRNLARSALDANITSLSQSRTLNGEEAMRMDWMSKQTDRQKLVHKQDFNKIPALDR